MKVYKFGGGVIQDPQSIRKLAQLIQTESGPLVVVVSALGKTTSTLENILQCSLAGQPYRPLLQELSQLHQGIIDQLLNISREAATSMLATWQEELLAALALPISDESLDQLYSQVVAWGEWLSSTIIHHYLQEQQLDCVWLDVRDYVKTNKGFCDAQVDWATTQRLIQKNFLSLLDQKKVILTQGFIASNEAGETTTLGKEGSDFTGAILATTLKTTSLTIWKDVPGVMSADPKLFKEAVKFDQLSYETIEKMAFHGAKVVHPKTIQPLAEYNIPLYVKPFHAPDAQGTVVNNESVALAAPVYILQENQVLLQLSFKHLTDFDELCIQEVIQQLQAQGLQASLLARDKQQLNICLNADAYQRRKLSVVLSPHFKIKTQQVSLITVLDQSSHLIPPWLDQEVVLCSQWSESTYQAAFLPRHSNSV